jgi:probable HAF family extracellular repeat protein
VAGGRTFAAAYDINDEGVIVGFAKAPDGFNHAVEWRPAAPDQ